LSEITKGSGSNAGTTRAKKKTVGVDKGEAAAEASNEVVQKTIGNRKQKWPETKKKGPGRISTGGGWVAPAKVVCVAEGDRQKAEKNGSERSTIKTLDTGGAK